MHRRLVLTYFAFFLKKNEKAVDYVDLRYDTGLAVGWKSPEQPSQES